MPKTIECRNGCGQQIWFDWERKYDDLGYREGSSKPNIPLECSDEGELLPKRHDCPKSQYNLSKNKEGSGSGSGTTITTTKTESIDSVALKGILGNTLDIIARVERLETRIDELSQFIKKLTDHLIHNPLDDDGDSTREEGGFPEQ